MSLRVALYAEGGGETLGALTLLPPPGDPLEEEHLGPAHVLVRRLVSAERRIPEEAIQFIAPLRTSRGPTARGSMLHTGKVVRKLLVWPLADRRPDIAVVLVDQDEDTQRKRDLDTATADLVVTRVVAVAVKEFESWLLADAAALRDALGPIDGLPPHPEGLVCGAAKERVADLAARWALAHDPPHDARDFRRAIAATCDLAVLAGRCPSFAAFRSEMRGLG